jgi:hypothetical protein
MVGQQCAVCPLSQRGAGHQQAHHVTLAAVVAADAAGVPLYDGTTGQGRQDDALTGLTGALHVHEHGQVIEGEVQHGSELFELWPV